MSPERWQKLDELFHSALQRDGDDRAAFLAKACNADADLLRELESMLAHHQQAKSFMESPAYAVQAESIVADDASWTLIGKTVGSYQVLSELGRGGMGEVYLAFDRELKRKVALKFLHADLTGNNRRLRRFKQEARAASALNHPNILTVFEIGEIEGQQFIATEFVEGRTLREAMNLGQIKLPQVFDISVQIASALATAHAAGIVHRDIKPENIMLRPDGFIKIVDFGLAKLTEEQSGDEGESTLIKTETGATVGTVTYMSPEQVRALDVDARTDIWSFGVVFYEMITGYSPFQGETSGDIIANILKSEPAPLPRTIVKLLPKLETLVIRVLAKDSAKRYQTMEQLLIDVRELKSQVASYGDLQTVKGEKKRALELIAFAAGLVLLIVIGAKFIGRTGPIATSLSSPSPISTVAAERTLTYGLTVQKMRNQEPYGQPFQSSAEESFQNGWKFRLIFSSPESGFLYLLNEARSASFDPPTSTVDGRNQQQEDRTNSNLSILYPEPSVGDGLIQPNKLTQTEWYLFDQNPGTEKLWVIWSANAVPELERVRRFLNAKDKGSISDTVDARALREFLVVHSSTKPQIQRDTEKRLIIAKANGHVLTSSLELVHH
jgi:serine/threonine protein kinase